MDVHRYVRGAYEDAPGLDKREVGAKLKFLLAERRKADYEDEFIGLAGTTEACIKMASVAISKVEALAHP